MLPFEKAQLKSQIKKLNGKARTANKSIAASGAGLETSAVCIAVLWLGLDE